MFTALLHDDDARRATETVSAVAASGLQFALTGGLAVAAQLRVHGRPCDRRHLNDVDLVVHGFETMPESLAAAFLLHHVHPDAAEGKMLLQLIDERNAVRVDLFRAFGNTLARASGLDAETAPLDVLSIEDLRARTTALVCGTLRVGKNIDAKHVMAFKRLIGLGRQETLAQAWIDHRQTVPGTLEGATHEVIRLLGACPELVAVEEYSRDITPCERCRTQGPFRPGPPDRIVQALGYW